MRRGGPATVSKVDWVERVEGIGLVKSRGPLAGQMALVDRQLEAINGANRAEPAGSIRLAKERGWLAGQAAS
eukprot:1889391-Alexandrium_andersonii.AAC.1